ncbi:DUF3173 family protein [Peptoniphilus equinus]|uniref:DUF3173 family protein n=1 Tax=Peptoniphilus equinus TaxID=3016343 RepID=A0ABY7QTA1_9FIRM|nr:DUF3173 family protein [Peptoniphilus equinus]WBW49304.1 DUF3173 family protein [Peptoniphilus equinus]
MVDIPELITKDFLLAKGFKYYTAVKIIRETKKRLVEKGYSFYSNPRLGVVPLKAVEEIVGYEFQSDK